MTFYWAEYLARGQGLGDEYKGMLTLMNFTEHIDP